jgi:hypothetical protein
MSNYVMGLKKLGFSYNSIAKSLHASPKTISGIARGNPPAKLYEPLRNLTRNTISQRYRDMGFSGRYVQAHRRINVDTFSKFEANFENGVKKAHKLWNESYYAYRKNPKEWHVKHRGRKVPKYISKKEVRRRWIKGQERTYDMKGSEQNYQGGETP